MGYLKGQTHDLSSNVCIFQQECQLVVCFSKHQIEIKRLESKSENWKECSGSQLLKTQMSLTKQMMLNNK